MKKMVLGLMITVLTFLMMSCSQVASTQGEEPINPKVLGTWVATKGEFKGEFTAEVYIKALGQEIKFLDTTFQFDTMVTTDSDEYYVTLEEAGQKYSANYINFNFTVESLKKILMDVALSGNTQNVDVDAIIQEILKGTNESGTWTYVNKVLTLNNGTTNSAYTDFDCEASDPSLLQNNTNNLEIPISQQVGPVEVSKIVVKYNVDSKFFVKKK